MKNFFCLFTLGKDLDKIIISNLEIILDLKKEFGNFTIISFSNFFLKDEIKEVSIDNVEKLKTEGVFIFSPKTKEEFKTYCSDKKIYGIDCIGLNYTYSWKFRRWLNKKNIFLILLLDAGYISNEQIGDHVKFKAIIYETKRFILRKFYRFLVFIKFFPPIFIYFECRKNIFEHFQKNQKFHFIEKIFPFFNIFNIKNIYLINSKHIDFSQRLKNHLPQDKIVFIDGNYKNDEFFFRENLDVKKIEQNYFIYLSKVLKKLESIFQKKIEIALHPSSDEKVYEKFFNKLDIQVSKGNTRKKIYQAYLVLFHESSAIMDAIFLKKKIISLSTDLFGKYHSDRVRFYKEKLKLLSIDIKEGVKLSKKDILQKLEAGIITYNQYLENINSEKNYLKSSEKVIKVLKSHIN